VASVNGSVTSAASATIWARAPTDTGTESTSLNSWAIRSMAGVDGQPGRRPALGCQVRSTQEQWLRSGSQPWSCNTPGPPTLDDVLGDDEADLGQLEDLAVFGIDHFGVVEVRTTRGAGGSWLITWSDSAICQVFARCNGLLFRACGGGPTLGTRSAGGFATPSADGGIDELRGLRPRHSSKSPASTGASIPEPEAVRSRTPAAHRKERRVRIAIREFSMVRAVFSLVVDQVVKGPE